MALPTVACIDPCPDKDIIGGVGDLNISSNTTCVGRLTVYDNPQLEKLQLPQVLSITGMNISDAVSLTEISFPMLNPSTASSSDDGLVDVVFVELQCSDDGSTRNLRRQLPSLNIKNAPNLSTIDLGSLSHIDDLVLFDTSPDLTATITTARSIQANGCVHLPNLEDVVGDLELSVNPSENSPCVYDLQVLRSVSGNLTILNADRLFADNFAVSNNNTPIIVVNGSLILVPSTPANPLNSGITEFGRITTIGNNLEISSMLNMSILFDGLADVGGTISLSNNTNCQFDFRNVSEATNITLVNNTDTTLPLFPKLEFVDNIHLQGEINISGGLDIFPSLKRAQGSVIIEPWNDDFNCSTLISQWNDGVINDLTCNGIRSGPFTSTGVSTSSNGTSRALPTGLVAGVGAGVGSFVLLVIVAIIGVVLHYKRRLKRLEQTKLTTPSSRGSFVSSHRADVSGTHEVDGQGIISEKPDDHIPAEKPDDHIVELPAGDEGKSSGHREFASN